ncbi:MAG: 50S ribosomal protein L3 N(5)-glutamine methyltransferase [Proteobacteria bacterium]|nr:50S ribosomal protein L3 N(5)-glutamine methyltransferase [Pseudomonadota bacterium]
MTLNDLIAEAERRLDEAGVVFGQGTMCAHDEAAWLVHWRLGLPLEGVDDRAVTEQEWAGALALVAERIRTRQPTAYLTGEAWLQGVPFHVDARSIVPRSLIAEVLADGLIDAWLGREPTRVLDLCTGNGSLAVLAALAWPEARVTGTDVSAEALAVAVRNVERHAPQVRLLKGSGWQPVAGERFDVVLCNPPYVNAQSMATLPPEFRAEPELALAGGADGMNLLRDWLPQAAAHLKHDGVLVLEIGHERAHFEAAFPHLVPVWLATSSGDDAVLLLTHEALDT